MSRTLQPDDRLAHYRIVSPLGAGGMGEVYLARDERLERSVALKVLPPQLVKSEERLRRFVLEAKSASSLNHPNIVTIYDVGQGDVPSAAGGSAPEPVHFISMELVTGDTLAGKIHHEKSDLKTLLGWLAQAAEGLAKAHAAGIVHRDLKPGNIMITTDGYAKVLDFGLAKLTERPTGGAELTEAPTEVADQTADGVILGTAGYMSPEQVQGKPVDHRTDIFAFGCILYEAATRQRPFVADSTVETLHKVLHEKPAPVEERNPLAPAELRRLIRRCLAKSPDQRLQSMKDLAIELREIVEEYDRLSATASSGATATMTMPAPDSGAATPTGPARRGGLPPMALAAIVLVGVAGIAFGIWGLRRGHAPAAGSARSLTLSALTSRGDVIGATLSRDGRYLAYTTQAPEANTIWVRQVATGSDVKVYSALGPPPRGLIFSPDGDYLYYIANDPETRGYSVLFQVASLGGEPRRRIYDIDSRASLSPDGRSVVFRRGIPGRNEVALIIADLESGQEKTLVAVTEPRILRGDPAWSPDGKLVVIGDTPGEADLKTRLSVFRVSDGREEKFNSPVWPFIGSVEWFPDGRALLVAALDLSGSPTFQVYRLGWPEGRAERLTSGFDNYQAASLSGDGRTIAAVRSMRVTNVWMVPVDPPGEPRAVTTFSGSENAAFFPFSSLDGTVVFSASQGAFSRLFAIRPGEDQPRQITRDDAHYFNYRVGRDAIIAQRIGADLIPHIWRLDLDGGNGRALTDGPGENIEAIAPDGLSGFFTRSDRPRELQVVPIDGGEPRRLLTDYEGVAEVSPDGRFLHYRTFRRNAGQGDFASGMVSLSGAPVPELPPPPPSAWDFLWDDSGRYLCWMDRAQPDWPVMRQPVDGGTPERVSRFSEGRVAGYRWTRPGRLAVNRTLGQVSNLWLFDTPGGEPRPLTRFPTGRIFEFDWMPDGRQIVATYGTLSQDVVLIKGFQ